MIAAEMLHELRQSRSVTHVTCAVVRPESTPPHRRRSITATVRPLRLSRYAAVSPVIPAPMTTTSTVRLRSSAGYREIDDESSQYDCGSSSADSP